MINRMYGVELLFRITKDYRLVPWAWSIAWMLTGVGTGLSDIYSSPSKSLIPYIALSAVGWGFAGIVTARAAGQKSGVAIRIVAWAVAYLVFVLCGLYWGNNWNIRFMGPIVATGVAGAIGGVPSSRRSGLWRLISGALVGFAFLSFATVSFYMSYFLIFSYSVEAQLLGDTGANVFIWGLPGAIFGLGAGFLASLILGITTVIPTDKPTLE
jgi:hypothetical protein